MDAVGELGGLRLDDERPLDDVYSGYTYFRDGDVVVAKITPCFENGKGALADGLTNGVGFGTTELHVLRPSRTLDARFLFYCTLADDFRSLGEAEMLGAGGQKRVPERFLNDWRLPLPPLETQRRIAQFLDEKTVQIDTLIAKKRALLDRLAEQRQALITHAVTKGLNPNTPLKPSGINWLGDIPAHWGVLPLKRLLLDAVGLQMGPFGGMLVNLPEYETGYKLYGQENTISGDFNLGRRWIEEERYLELRRYEILEGDLVITRKGSLGNCRRVPSGIPPGIGDSDTIRLRPDPALLSSDWAIVLLHEAAFITDQIASERRGAILSGLNTTVVGSLLFTVPPIEEQALLMQQLTGRLKPFEKVQKATVESIEKLSEYRSALITAAVTGQIAGLQ